MSLRFRKRIAIEKLRELSLVGFGVLWFLLRLSFCVLIVPLAVDLAASHFMAINSSVFYNYDRDIPVTIGYIVAALLVFYHTGLPQKGFAKLWLLLRLLVLSAVGPALLIFFWFTISVALGNERGSLCWVTATSLAVIPTLVLQTFLFAEKPTLPALQEWVSYPLGRRRIPIRVAVKRAQKRYARDRGL